MKSLMTAMSRVYNEHGHDCREVECSECPAYIDNECCVQVCASAVCKKCCSVMDILKGACNA